MTDLFGLRKGLTVGSLLGRCNFCTNKIQQDVKNVASQYALVHNAKWLCGDCVVGMSERVAETSKKAAQWVAMMEVINVNIEPTHVVDLKTGKLVPCGNGKKSTNKGPRRLSDKIK
jgi:hypothetical protein